MSEKFQENVTVLKQQCIGKDIYDMTIQTKEIAGHAKAGQFVSLYSNDASKLLPRPISLCGIDREAGTLRLVYRVTGEGTGTEEFSRLKAGDTIRVLGPLGNGFTVEALHCSFNSSNALCQTNGITSSTCSVSSIQATWCNAFSVVRLCFRVGC